MVTEDNELTKMVDSKSEEEIVLTTVQVQHTGTGIGDPSKVV